MQKLASAIRRFETSRFAGVTTVVLWCAGLLGTMLYFGRLC